MELNIDLLLIAIGATLMVLGVIGCIVPVLPGVIFSYAGILLLHFTQIIDFSSSFLISWAIVVLIVEFLDYFIPIWGTKMFGGGKKGSIGCTIGIVIGIFAVPWGIIVFPFLGAVAGELLDKKPVKGALKAGFGAFLGFVAGTFMQVVVALILAFYFFKYLIAAYWGW